LNAVVVRCDNNNTNTIVLWRVVSNEIWLDIFQRNSPWKKFDSVVVNITNCPDIFKDVQLVHSDNYNIVVVSITCACTTDFVFYEFSEKTLEMKELNRLSNITTSSTTILNLVNDTFVVMGTEAPTLSLVKLAV
jgi:hypothetical protein